MIVVDTNILAYAFIEGAFTKEARAFLEDLADWAVPPIFEHEMTNILVSYGRFKGFSSETCTSILRDILQVARERIVDVDLMQALEFSVKHDIASYDGEFLWLAESERTVCVTQDREMLKKFPALAKSLRHFRAV